LSGQKSRQKPGQKKDHRISKISANSSPNDKSRVSVLQIGDRLMPKTRT